MKRQRKRSCVIVVLLLIGGIAAADAGPTATLDAQRAAFREVFPEAELGKWQPADQRTDLLRDYVLWPDLRGAFLRATVAGGNDADIREYLDRYGTLKPARELRYRYALTLAAAERFADFLEIYRQYYMGLDVARLDCIALHAEILGDRYDRIANRAMELWLVGSSQEKECEPVFDHMRDTGLLGPEAYRQRFELAVEARQFNLARYLSAPLPPEYREQATRWLASQNEPSGFLDSPDRQPDGEIDRRQIVYAIQNISFRDPELAAQFWSGMHLEHAFNEQQAIDVERHIALWSARHHLPLASAHLQQLPAAALNTETQRWMVRASLRQQDWQHALQHIRALPADELAAEQWQYWLAATLVQLGRADEALAIFETLANGRGYYGFLAADELGAKYAFSHESMQPDEEMMHELAQRPAFIRARELFLVGLEGRGRSEWDAAISYLSAEQKIQAAILAHRWGWHSRAIATAAMVGEFDDLRIRYPLPYADSFRLYSSAARIQPSWAYGIARSESLFMRDIRSSAGAIGVMQLMPETGRRTARRINFPYAGRVTLTDPDSNIRLGTEYLRQMYERFDENRVLATAAYNAGPINVGDWLPENGAQDARIWIENIPFDETRSYVRRVFETDAIFHWRMTGKVRRISSELSVTVSGPGPVVSID